MEYKLYVIDGLKKLQYSIYNPVEIRLLFTESSGSVDMQIKVSSVPHPT
jgi:hypothetical protein